MTAGLIALGIAAAALPVAAAQGADADLSGAAIRCAGRAATIVTDDRKVVGTPGADVIVVRSRRTEVDAGAGDDTICVRTGRGYTFIEAGDGDDRIRVESTTFTFASLGEGRDTYRGGAGSDHVATGWPGDVNHDRVLLGGGADAAYVRPSASHRKAVLVGGAGADEIQVEVRDGTLHVDAAAALATHRGDTYATWQSFEAHALYSDGAQVFTGSEGDDEVIFGGWGAVTATTLGGDDVVRVSVDADVSDADVTGSDVSDSDPAVLDGRREAARTPAGDITLDLGPGQDQLDIASWARLVRADIALARVDLSSDADTTGSFGFASVEDLTVHAQASRRGEPSTRVTLVGDDQDNRLQAHACHVEVRGGAGDDHVRVGAPLPDAFVFIVGGGPQPKSCRRSSDVDGGTGDDVMVSRVMEFDLRGFELGDRIRAREVPVRDLLDGGEGNDTADAGGGTDTCLAEVRVDCEA